MNKKKSRKFFKKIKVTQTKKNSNNAALSPDRIIKICCN